MIKNKKSYVVLGFLILLFNITMIIFPNEVVLSSTKGLELWLKSVFPSLLPFLIGMNIINKLGIVSFFGVLLSPITYRLFGVSGIGVYPLVAGLTSGYPVGAKTTCLLYLDGRLTKKEATKLICFTNNSGPLFIIGVVGTCMYKNAMVGYFILIIHIFNSNFSWYIDKYF